MSDLEQLTVTLPADVAGAIRNAVARGEYASSSEVVHSALREWTLVHGKDCDPLSDLQSDLETGLRDAADGRVKGFDTEQIVERGRRRSLKSSSSI